MAQRLSYICEVCLDQNRETLAVPFYLVVGDIGGMLDLCTEHDAKILGPLRALLRDSGRPTGSDRPGSASLPVAVHQAMINAAPADDRIAPGAMAKAEAGTEADDRRQTSELLAALARAERSVGIAGISPVAAPAPAPVEPAPVVEPTSERERLDGVLGPWSCPGCLGTPALEPFPSPSSLSKHVARNHGLLITDVYAAIGRCRMEGCGYHPEESEDDGGSLARHAATAHDMPSLSSMICYLALTDPARVEDLMMMFFADERVLV